MSEQNSVPAPSDVSPNPKGAGAPASRRGPVEALDRRTLERRYRLMRNFAVLLVALVAVLGTVSIGQLVQLQGGAAQAAPAAQQASEGGSAVAAPNGEPGSCPAPVRREASDPMALGDVDAPVVLVEWTDFRCPFCGVFSRDTLPVLVEEYIETGKVRLEMHDVDFIEGEVSANVAVAARAAGEQGRYFEYLFAIYDDMTDDRPAITPELLLDYAKRAEVPDLERFEADLGSPELAAAVQRSSEQAKGLGVDSVPFFVDTESCGALKGAQPIDEFRRYLDAAVASAEAR